MATVFPSEGMKPILTYLRWPSHIGCPRYSCAVTGAPARAIRALLAGLVVAGTATAAHHLAGGCLDPAVLGAILVGFVAIAWPLTARRIDTSQFVGLLVLGQVIVHVNSCCELPAGRMLAAHAVATTVSAVVLRHGESALWALVDALCLRLPTLWIVATRAAAGALISRSDGLRASLRLDNAAPRGPPCIAI